MTFTARAMQYRRFGKRTSKNVKIVMIWLTLKNVINKVQSEGKPNQIAALCTKNLK